MYVFYNQKNFFCIVSQENTLFNSKKWLTHEIKNISQLFMVDNNTTNSSEFIKKVSQIIDFRRK